MPIIVTYQSGSPPTASLTGQTVSVVAVAGESYHHDGRPVASLEITLPSTATAGVINVTPTHGQPMPEQSCATSYDAAKSGVYKSEWTMSSSAGQGVMKLTIPGVTSEQFTARMSIIGAGLMNITVKR